MRRAKVSIEHREGPAFEPPALFSEMGGRPVEKPIGMREKEIEFDRPFKELVMDLYTEHRTYEGVSKALGISRQTLQIWLRLVGLRNRDLRLGAPWSGEKRATAERHRHERDRAGRSVGGDAVPQGSGIRRPLRSAGFREWICL